MLSERAYPLARTSSVLQRPSVDSCPCASKMLHKPLIHHAAAEHTRAARDALIALVQLEADRLITTPDRRR